MYLYVYDAFVQDRRYEKEIQKVENRLTDLGIAGKIIRLGLFRRADEFIRDEVKHGGATTVVAVGNDTTVRQVIDVVTEAGVVLGIIPFGPESRIANLLGIPEGEAACDILSARIVETLDTGAVNGKRFVCNVSLPAVKAEIQCEGNYRITPQGRGTIEVRNLFAPDEGGRGAVSNPTDGCLEVVIQAEVKSGGLAFWRTTRGESVIPLRSLEIRTPEPVSALMDGVPIEGSRFEFSVKARALKVITGKERSF
ncbi:MAG: diacylglycerol kinase family protein [Candidatus Uhrbacteria bacterium]